jgi:hypothetical protein
VRPLNGAGRNGLIVAAAGDGRNDVLPTFPAIGYPLACGPGTPAAGIRENHDGALSIPADPFVVQVPGPEQAVPARRSRDCEGDGMTEYVILIYENEDAYVNASPEVWQTAMEAHNRFAGQVGERGGKIVGGNALQPTATATSIRDDVVTDGPFAETKEALGGFYLIEARDLDHALEIAKLCPAPYGGVEVRPVMDTSGG